MDKNSYSSLILEIQKSYQVHKLPIYALELASLFHSFYQKCQVLVEDKGLSNARVGLITGVKIILKNCLDLMGISAPEKM
ncbi:MAG: DALR anticodon-binding domain-containing protein [Candidatus Hermodarchaeota archaeon]